MSHETVFLHAVGFTGETLRGVANRSGGDGLCFDVIGHGAATAPEGYVYSQRNAAERILAQLPPKPIDKKRFGFGHSGGGTVLLWAEILAPGTFDGLFLYEPPARVLPPEAFAPGQQPTLAESVKYRRNRFADHAEFEDYLRVRQPFSGFSEEALQAYIQTGIRPHPEGGYCLSCSPEFESMMYSTPDPDLVDNLERLSLPVIIARGENTADRFQMMCDALVQRIRGSRLVVIPEVTHFGPLEDPELVARYFRAEMAEVDDALLGRDAAPTAS